MGIALENQEQLGRKFMSAMMIKKMKFLPPIKAESLFSSSARQRPVKTRQHLLKAESLSSFSVGQGVFPAALRKHGNNPQAPTGRNQPPI